LSQKITATQARKKYFACPENSPWVTRYARLWAEKANQEARSLADACSNLDEVQKLYDEAPESSKAEDIFRKLWFDKAKQSLH
jgi:hypothetical protein